jgi:DNA-binding winged helix-turn-helix (wHTH) protein
VPYPEQRVLLRADKPLSLGSRAREILLVLVERAGELVKKSELIASMQHGLCLFRSPQSNILTAFQPH